MKDREAQPVSAIKVTFVEDDGTERAFDDAETGQSLMELGRAHDVRGILADCGGACACATCHVYVDPDWVERVGPPDEIEAEMLDMVSDLQKPNSRLSCQVRLTDALDGLRVTVAPSF
jgi:ferredoxin, 2Fe-2S